MKLAFLVKFQTENFVFVQDKIKQNPGCPNKEYIQCNLQAHSSEYLGLS